MANEEARKEVFYIKIWINYCNKSHLETEFNYALSNYMNQKFALDSYD